MTTHRKWLYAGIFNFIASFISLGAHLIPTDGIYTYNFIKHSKIYHNYFHITLKVSLFQRMILLMVTSMASKIAISTTLSILMTCTTEIVSPEKRRLCGYTSTIWTRIWLLSAPFVGATSIFGQIGILITIQNKTFLYHILYFSVPQTFLALLNLVGSIATTFIQTPRTIENKPSKEFYPKEIPIPDIWLSSYKQYEK